MNKAEYEALGVKFVVATCYKEVPQMVPGYPYDTALTSTTRIGKEYIPAIWVGPWEIAYVPGFDQPVECRRKAKRALNRYRKFRARYFKMTSSYAPFHY